MPFKELKSIANIPVSEQTIRRRLKEKGIRKWRALERALLRRTCPKAIKMGKCTSTLDDRRLG
jgi:hypothetical protein